MSHNKRYYSTTSAFPGAQNDKTIVHYDATIRALATDPLFKDFEFELLQEDGTVRKHKGAYAINDGGYHRWRHTINGWKHSVDEWEQRLSKRLESVRKDSECVFGICKKRFRILRLPFNLADAVDIERVFKTSIAFHNMLHDVDGYGDLGELEEDWIAADLDADELRLERTARARDAEANIIRREDVFTVDDPWAQYDAEIPIDEVETSTDYDSFRAQLVIHFKKKHERGEIEWLRPAREARPRG